MLQFQLSKTVLADISACAERYIGTQGGGMDQAIAFLGKSGIGLNFNTFTVHVLIVVLLHTSHKIISRTIYVYFGICTGVERNNRTS